MATLNSSAKQLVWFITGTSSGFGKRLVNIALARGDRVTATARNLAEIQALFPKSDRLRTIQLDVVEGLDNIKAKVKEAVDDFGRIDVVVNNAGIGDLAFVEEGGSKVFMHQMQINVCGLLDVTSAVLPYMRAQRSGTVVMIGSRSSWETNVPLRGFYGASKAAVRVLADTLQVEVKPFGIRVITVEPGPFRTEKIYSQPLYEKNRISDYNPMLHKVQEIVKTTIDGFQPGDPQKAMEVLADVVRGEGRAAGKEFPPCLPLGEEAEAAIRDKCDSMLKLVDEWGSIIRDTKLDSM